MQRDVVEQAMRGDKVAFSQLFRGSTPRLNGVAYLILRGRLAGLRRFERALPMSPRSPTPGHRVDRDARMTPAA